MLARAGSRDGWAAVQGVDELIKAAADRETSGDLAAAYALCEQALATNARHPAAAERAARSAAAGWRASAASACSHSA